MATLEFNVRNAFNTEEEDIMVTAYQNKRFLKAVNKRVGQNGGRRAAGTAQAYVNGLIKTLKNATAKGIPGATDQNYKGYSPGPVNVTINVLGSRTVGPHSVRTAWDDLAASTVRQKRNTVGKGKFYKMKGDLGSAMAAIQPPTVHWDSTILPDTVRREGKGDTRIDFEIRLRVDPLPFPLDDLVRRPFITGNDRVGEPDGYTGSDLWKLAALEFGTDRNGTKGKGIPARPWLAELSAQLGYEMKEALFKL